MRLRVSASAQEPSFTAFDPPSPAGTFAASFNPAGEIARYHYRASDRRFPVSCALATATGAQLSGRCAPGP